MEAFSVFSTKRRLIKKEENWKLIGSSDLSRNIDAESTERVDRSLLKRITKLDVKGFFNAINKTHANVCGYGVVATMLFAAKELGAKKAEVLKYGTSEGTSEGGVTGFASAIFY